MGINLLTFIIAIIIPLLFKILTSLLQIKLQTTKEKISPFECGFDPLSKSRIPFSLRFFLLSVLFLVFDVEVALILPLPLVMEDKSLVSFLLPLSVFIIILVIGLYHE